MRKISMTIALLAVLVVAHTGLAAQTARSAMSACERARADLRVELARGASTRPHGGWGTGAVHSTSNGASITTTQRTLYQRSHAVLDSARTLLDSIRPLHPDVDEPTIEQTRPRLRARLGELMVELEREDGPRYEIMEPALADAAALVMRLGLVLCRAGAVNAEDEASTVARYVRLEHGVAMARRDWIAAGAPRRAIMVAAGPSTATGLPAMPAPEPTNVAGVADSLDAVTQSLDSLESALDGVLAVEMRDSVKVIAPDATQHTLAEVLTRVERFAAEDAPRVLEGGGADALPTLSAAADTLRQLVRALRLPAPGATSAAEEAESSAQASAGAQAALERLAQRLDALYRLLGSPARD
jgi:hypothetical protein